jgi:hypothetical protein
MSNANRASIVIGRVAATVVAMALVSSCTHLGTKENLWRQPPSQQAKAALEPFARGQIGQLARTLRLANLRPDEIDTIIEKAGACTRSEDVLRVEESGEAALCQNRSVRQVIWSCDDGSVFRYKPEGDPCNRHRPQAHGSKAVVWPLGSQANRFASEAFKVTEDGEAIPKHPRELRSGADVGSWADRAHFDLAPKAP